MSAGPIFTLEGPLARWRKLAEASAEQAEAPMRPPGEAFAKIVKACRGLQLPLGAEKEHRDADQFVGSSLLWLARTWLMVPAGRRIVLAPAVAALALDVGRILDGKPSPEPPGGQVVRLPVPAAEPDDNPRVPEPRRDLFG